MLVCSSVRKQKICYGPKYRSFIRPTRPKWTYWSRSWDEFLWSTQSGGLYQPKISIAEYVEELAVSKQSFQGKYEKAGKDALTSSAFSSAPVRGLLRKACFPNIRPVPICDAITPNLRIRTTGELNGRRSDYASETLRGHKEYHRNDIGVQVLVNLAGASTKLAAI
jgi:hypothetical protein